MSQLHTCQRLVLATTNPHKLRELQSLLAPLGVLLLGLTDVEKKAPEAIEDGATLAANARLKAKHYARCLSEWVLSDDTGLGVDALGGAPGVRSARYAGDGATMVEHRARLLSELAGIDAARRTARFVCCFALAAPDGEIVLEASGECAGRIRTEPAGNAGFGYDVLFEVEGIGRTLAELDAAETALFGHRGHAARQFIAAWRQATGR
jgi:XTP/dITP diphosphohydrolase